MNIQTNEYATKHDLDKAQILTDKRFEVMQEYHRAEMESIKRLMSESKADIIKTITTLAWFVIVALSAVGAALKYLP